MVPANLWRQAVLRGHGSTRRRRLEAFTTDAKIIRLTRRRVAIFLTAAMQQFFDGDCDADHRTSDPVGSSSEKGGKAPR